jgi:hypothetical protein
MAATSTAIDACVVNWDAIEAYVLARAWPVLDSFCRQIDRVRLAGSGGSLRSRGAWVLETASCLMQAGGRSLLPTITKSDGERQGHGLLVELASERISYVSHSDRVQVIAVDWVGLRTSLEVGDTKSVNRIVRSAANAISALDEQPDSLVGLLPTIDAFVRGERTGALATIGRAPSIDELLATIGQ